VPKDSIISEARTSDGISLKDILSHPYCYDLLLQHIPHLGPKSYQKCMEAFSSPRQVFLAQQAELKPLGLKKQTIDEIAKIKLLLNKTINEPIKNKVVQGVMADIAWLNKPNHYVLRQNDIHYPKLLKQIYDAPALLFVIGNVNVLNNPQLAIVGSRRPSKTGTIDTYHFSQALTQLGLTITSGLASGIDTFAHDGALAAYGFPKGSSANAMVTDMARTGATTIAVLAHGLDSIYPKTNANLAAKIINHGGAIISEFSTGVKPRPEYFPRRNRIISGLSLGVLVVEAAIKSGSLITAYSALEQNREVFAIPGSIHNPVSKGCHQLIKKGAKLVETTEDILEELPDLNTENMISVMSDATEQSAIDDIASYGLSEKQQQVLQQLNHEEQSTNMLATILDYSISDVSAALVILELKQLCLQGEFGYSRLSSI